MTEVTGKEFYHIHRLEDNSKCANKHSYKWAKGNILSFGVENFTETNLLHDRIFNPHININWEKKLVKQLSCKRRMSILPKEKKDIQIDFYKKGLMFKYFQLSSEIILEDVRQSLFPDKPSRLNGVWLTSKENMEIWLKIFPKDEFRQKIFLVKFTGKIHKADARWITNITLSFESIYKSALGYWNGELQSNRGKPHEEYICNGYLEIIEEIT